MLCVLVCWQYVVYLCRCFTAQYMYSRHPSASGTTVTQDPCSQCSGPNKAYKQVQRNCFCHRQTGLQRALHTKSSAIHNAFRKEASSLVSNLQQATPYLLPELQKTGIHPACHSNGCSRTVPSRQADTSPSGQTARPVMTAAARPPFNASPNRPLTARQRTGRSQQPNPGID